MQPLAMLRRTPGAVHHLAFELATGGINIIATGASHRRNHAGIVEQFLEAANGQIIRALEAGEIMTLQKALTKISQEVPGQVIKVELEREQGRWVYEFKLLRQGGEQIKLVVNAVNGEVLQTKSKSSKRK